MSTKNRAYSLLDIKAVDDEKRILTGLATTPSVDRMGDIVDPLGAEFQLPIPFLWQHDSANPVGSVTKAKVTKAGIEVEIQIQRTDEPGLVKDRLDAAWQDIKLRLVRGLSIGFSPIESARIEGSYGMRFIRWLWLELSGVTVAANGDCTIQTIKSIDTELRAATGHEQAGADRPVPPGASGKSTKPVNLRPKEATKMNISEQIVALEAKRAANQARMEDIQNKAAEEGRTKDASEKEDFKTIADENDEIDEELKDLRRMEKAKAIAAKPIPRTETAPDGTQARSGIVVIQPKLAPGIAFARLARVKALAKMDGESPRTIAKELYGEDSPVYRLLIKAAVPAATTTNATWAGALVGDETSVYADFVEWLRPQTIVGRFGTNGIPSLRQVPFRVPLIGQTSGGNAYWVGEGKPKPLTKFDFERKTLEPLKVANIAVATMETIRDSSPSAEVIIRDQLGAALRERMDLDFIDPAKAAVAGISPASITNGVVAIPSSGNDADDVRTDIKALFGAFIAANNAPTDGVWIMSSVTALALSLMQNPLGQTEFPGIGMNGGTFFGLPAIVSQYVPAGFVVLANASDIYLADEGGIDVDMSTQASLQMDDAPTNASDPVTATSLVSLWQTNSVGFRAERTIDWMRRRASAVAVLSGVNWGAPAAP